MRQRSVRMIEENEDGFGAMGGILSALIYLFIWTPIMLIVDLVRKRRRRNDAR